MCQVMLSRGRADCATEGGAMLCVGACSHSTRVRQSMCLLLLVTIPCQSTSADMSASCGDAEITLLHVLVRSKSCAADILQGVWGLDRG